MSGLLAGPTAPCVSPARSDVPYEYVLNAMFDHAVRWARENRRPPAAPYLEITDTTTSPATLTRDAYQLARGGIRLAAVEAPTERNTGWNIGLTDATTGACRQGGTWIPFDETTLDELYPTHRDYVSKVRQVTQQNLRQAGSRTSLCGKPVHPLPICDWSMPFSPRATRACPACVRLAAQPS